MRSSLVVIAAVAASALVAPGPASSQSATSATVSGTVTASTGQPIRGALVTLTALGTGGSHEATTDGAGNYSFALVAPGSYEVRAEALGYRPVVARTLTLAGGEQGSVSLSLTAAPPPVVTVDTVALSASVSSPWRAGGTRIGATDIDDLPNLYQDLTSLAALSSSLDASLGSEGLPGSMTQLVVDGVPVWRAPDPLARAEQLSDALFPRSALDGMVIYDNAPDVDLSGSAGAYLSLATRTGTRGGGLDLEGAWSGDPLWSSSELDISKPSLTSFRGTARTAVPLSPGVSQVVVSADVLHEETPLAARLAESVGAALSSLDPDVVAGLTAPSIEQVERVSGQVRLDAQSGETSRLFLRGDVAYSDRKFDGPGPVTLARAVALPEESVDFSVAGGLTSQYRPGVQFELRGGVSGSSRTFDPATDGMPSAFLVGTGAALGVLPGGSGKSSRVDGVLTPSVRLETGPGALELGMSARLSSQKLTQGKTEEFFYSDGSALVAGQGFVHTLDAPEASFSTREVSGFVQYRVQPTPALSASFGGRFDYEMIPSDGPRLNSAWLQASGIRNTDYPNRFSQLGGRASVTWDPSRDGSTTVSATVTAHQGDLDPKLLAQVFSQDGAATSTYFAGTGLDWPMSSLPAGATPLPTLTLFGPDTRAPRSVRGSFDLVRRLVGSWSVHLGASSRRSDFLMRRRNLNLPAQPQAVDAYGRNVFGTLQQDGSLVSATGSEARRFPGFNEVWALDPDGWSKYRGASVGVQYGGPSTSLYVSYTRSKTTDNWLGASQALVDAELSPLLPSSDGDWSEGTSDFDVPDRVAAAASTRLGPVTVSALYRYRSGLPFTPRYRAGVDANGDGSYRNDVAYVDATVVDPLLGDWPCLSGQTDGFAERNSCRGPAVHSLDAQLRVRLGSLMGREAALEVGGFNLVESGDGVIDDALLLVDPTASITSAGGTVTIPVIVNPDFGKVLYPSSRGRMIRIGFRIG